VRPWPLRLALLVVIGSFVLLTPALEQVRFLRVRSPAVKPYLHSWRMYSGHGRDSCDVQIRAKVGGRWRSVDHVALLRGKPWTELPPHRRRTHRKHIDHVASQVCERLKADDVRMVATCGTRRGWRSLGDPARNHCEATP